ncbi:MAG: hypothetical protein OXT49_01790 [Gammaproteobacteria bacterium]|nr:hypothetical protein [Gammaproteobacteria bacterium]
MDIRVERSQTLPTETIQTLYELFDAGYKDADLSYLDKAIETFRYVAIAEEDGELVGFSFGDSLLKELPQMEGEQAIALPGLACVSANIRQQGFFKQLTLAAIGAGEGVDGKRPFLFAGRMAHPITYRAVAANFDSTVPSVSKPITGWHQEVAEVVGGLLGSSVDLDTFVVKGAGKPVGYPRLEYEATAEELAVFEQVNRDQGDSLLAMCWMPVAPAGW